MPKTAPITSPQRRGYKLDGRIDLRRLPQIVETRLGQRQAEGMAAQLLHTDAGGDPPGQPDPSNGPILFLDTKLKGRAQMEAALHEALHLACPFLFEPVVLQVGRYLAMVMWKLGFRRVEN